MLVPAAVTWNALRTSCSVMTLIRGTSYFGFCSASLITVGSFCFSSIQVPPPALLVKLNFRGDHALQRAQFFDHLFDVPQGIVHVHGIETLAKSIRKLADASRLI